MVGVLWVDGGEDCCSGGYGERVGVRYADNKENSRDRGLMDAWDAFDGVAKFFGVLSGCL